jgi:hypothetical protein
MSLFAMCSFGETGELKAIFSAFSLIVIDLNTDIVYETFCLLNLHCASRTK